MYVSIEMRSDWAFGIGGLREEDALRKGKHENEK
jgi:hypothetical protein